jgi:hypothetical protein
MPTRDEPEPTAAEDAETLRDIAVAFRAVSGFLRDASKLDRIADRLESRARAAEADTRRLADACWGVISRRGALDRWGRQHPHLEGAINEMERVLREVTRIDAPAVGGEGEADAGD